MIVILLGPPGAGKGTVSDFISKKFNLFYLSTGDILRKKIESNTSSDNEVAKLIREGKLIPDEMINQLVLETITSTLYQNKHKGFLFDGFPRTVAQANFIDEILINNSLKVNAVLLINCADEIIIKRITSRRICPKTGKIYNLETNPPPADEHLELIQRPDDVEDVIKKRLDVYKEQSFPLVNFYEKKKVIFPISAERTIEEVTHSIDEILSNLS